MTRWGDYQPLLRPFAVSLLTWIFGALCAHRGSTHDAQTHRIARI